MWANRLTTHLNKGNCNDDKYCLNKTKKHPFKSHIRTSKITINCTLFF